MNTKNNIRRVEFITCLNKILTALLLHNFTLLSFIEKFNYSTYCFLRDALKYF